MNKKHLLVTLASLLLLLGLTQAAFAPISRPDHLIIATIGEPETVDPAWLYDTASAELGMNVYDTLIAFDVDRTVAPEDQGQTDEFTPGLATDWFVSEDMTYYQFEIRGQSGAHTWEAVPPNPYTFVGDPRSSTWHDITANRWFSTGWHLTSWIDTNHDGVLSVSDLIDAERDQWPGNSGSVVIQKFHVDWIDAPLIGVTEMPVLFHNGATLTPGDIEYSLERWMVQDRSGGPTWMILEPLLQAYGTELTAAFAQSIDDSVESNATHVVLNLVAPFPSMIVYQTVAQSWAGILNKAWAVAQGSWPGFDVTGYDPAVWGAWNDPEVSELDDPVPVMMGTGPYKLDYWDKGIEWSIVWFPEHWQQWPPIPWVYQGFGYTEGWLKRVTEKFIPEWATRKMMFLACDVDFVYIPRMHITEVILNWPDKPEIYVPNVRCFRELPTISCSPVMFYGFDVSPDSTYLGPDFNPATPYAMGETRMRVDMFSDPDVRKGFSYAFDYDTYIRDVYLGEADRCITPVVDTLPYYNPAQTGYDYNLALAETHLRNAFGGDLWANGFSLTLAYNTGNVPRRIASEMTIAALESMNPLFHIDIASVPWPQYLGELVSFKLTAFVLGWLADYPDPHNFVFPFMHTDGTFSYFQGYSNPAVDTLIEDGIATPDGPAREAIYYELQQIYVDDNPSVPLAKPTGRHWEKDWILGWYYNPIYPGGYFKHYWKGYLGDMDRDYDVDLDDLFLVLIWYCEPNPPPEYDWDHDGHVDLDDLFHVLINYGK